MSPGEGHEHRSQRHVHAHLARNLLNLLLTACQVVRHQHTRRVVDDTAEHVLNRRWQIAVARHWRFGQAAPIATRTRRDQGVGECRFIAALTGGDQVQRMTITVTCRQQRPCVLWQGLAHGRKRQHFQFAAIR